MLTVRFDFWSRFLVKVKSEMSVACNLAHWYNSERFPENRAISVTWLSSWPFLISFLNHIPKYGVFSNSTNVLSRTKLSGMHNRYPWRYLSVYCWHLHAGFDRCGSHLITPFWFLYFLCNAFLQFLSTDRPFFRCIEIFISELPFLAALNGHFWTLWSLLSLKLSQRRFHMSDTILPRVTLLTHTALNG